MEFLRAVIVVWWGVLKGLWDIIAIILLFFLKKIWSILEPFLGWLVNWLKKQTIKHPYGVSSFALHFILLVTLIGGLPEFFDKKKDEIQYISVEMLPIKDITNVKPEVEQKPEIKEEPKQEEKKEKKIYSKPKAEIKKEVTPEVKVSEKPKIDLKKKPKIEEKPKEEVKKEEKKENTKKVENDFESVLRSVEKMKEQPSQQKKSNTATNFDPNKPLSMSEIDAVKKQIAECWSVPVGAVDAENTVVSLRLSLTNDGTVRSVKILDQDRYNKESFFRAAADSAVRAVNRCSPLKGLPSDKYSSWKEMEMNFDPKEIL